MPKRILIVEDSIDIGDALQKLLELQGYRSVVAQTGSEGLELAQANHPLLILVDLVLPDMHGLDMVRQMRSIEELADTPIICVSSYAEGIEDQVIEAGCDEVFSKTEFMVAFKDVLRKYLGENK